MAFSSSNEGLLHLNSNLILTFWISVNHQSSFILHRATRRLIMEVECQNYKSASIEDEVNLLIISYFIDLACFSLYKYETNFEW